MDYYIDDEYVLHPWYILKQLYFDIKKQSPFKWMYSYIEIHQLIYIYYMKSWLCQMCMVKVVSYEHFAFCDIVSYE